MFPPRPTELLHSLLSDCIAPGDLAIDATAGKGHDTVFLARAVGPGGKVIAIDIQEEAISATRARLEEAGLLGNVSLRLGSHVDLLEIADGGAPSAILFNLGYLPGGDHTLITKTDDTVAALTSAVSILRPGGTLAVICYPGHPGGDGEALAVEGSVASLSGFRTARYGMIGTERPSPFLLVSRKPLQPGHHHLTSHLPRCRSGIIVKPDSRT